MTDCTRKYLSARRALSRKPIAGHDTHKDEVGVSEALQCLVSSQTEVNASDENTLA